ncbi:MAG: choline kinase [Nonlabens sp.]|jgi:choline kinase
MIAIILAAGRGSRLEKYTNNLPKSLLPLVDNQTILDYNLDLLTRISVDHVYIITGYNSEMIEKHIEKRTNVSTVYNPFWNHCNVLGSFYMSFPVIREDFLFLHADTLADEEVWNKLKMSEKPVVLPFERKICGEEEMKVLIDQEGKLVEISKTMNPDVAAGEFLGIAKFSYSLLGDIKNASDKLFKTGDLNYYMESVITQFINQGVEIETFSIGDSRFVEIDFEEDYLKARDVFGAKDK